MRFRRAAAVFSVAALLFGVVGAIAWNGDVAEGEPTTVTAMLHPAHRGAVNPGFESGSCPAVPVGSSSYGWHFVLGGNDSEFVTVDAVFAEAGHVTAFVSQPTAKHAYVYTPGPDTLVDATAQVTGSATRFNLSHVCAGVTTTTTEAPTTTTVEITTTTMEATTTTTAAPTTTTTAAASTTTTEAPTTTTTEAPTTTTVEITTTTVEATTTTTAAPTTTTTEEPTTTTVEATTTTAAPSTTTSVDTGGEGSDPGGGPEEGGQPTGLRLLPRTGRSTAALVLAGLFAAAAGAALRRAERLAREHR